MAVTHPLLMQFLRKLDSLPVLAAKLIAGSSWLYNSSAFWPTQNPPTLSETGNDCWFDNPTKCHHLQLLVGWKNWPFAKIKINHASRRSLSASCKLFGVKSWNDNSCGNLEPEIADPQNTKIIHKKCHITRTANLRNQRSWKKTLNSSNHQPDPGEKRRMKLVK